MSSGLDPKLLVPAVILYIPVMWALIHCDIAEDMRKGIAMAIVINALYVVFGEPQQQQAAALLKSILPMR